MAVKKTIELDVNTSAGLKAMDELGLSFEQAFTEADNLSGQIGELEDALYAMAAAGQTNTKEYKELSEQIGVYKKVIIDTDMQVDAMSQTTAQKMGGALSGVTSGFELGAGAMGAFGAESEQVEAALLKVQSAMAISQGIDGIRQAIPAFKAMKSAIMANTVVQKVLNVVMSMNPIGLIVLAVAALGAAIVALWGPIKKLQNLFMGVAENVETATAANERLNKSFEKQDKIIDKLIAKKVKQGQDALAILESEGASADEIHKKKLDNLLVEEQARKLQMAKIESQMNKRRVAFNKALAEGNQEEADAAAADIRTNKEKYDNLEAMHSDYNTSKTVLNNNFDREEKAREESNRAERQANYRAALDAKKAFDAARLAATREIEDREQALKFQNEQAEREANRVQFEREKADILANTELLESEKLRLIELAAEEAGVRRNEISAKYQAEADEAVAIALEAKSVREAEELLALEERLAAEAAILEEKRQKDIDDHLKAEKEKEEATAARFEKATNALNYLDELNTTLTDAAVMAAGDNEAAAEAARKKGFERSKKLQMGMAVITGIQGVMAAFTAGSSMGPAGVVMGPLMAGLAAVTAGVNIAKIAKTKYEGGGASVAGAATGSTSPPRVPSFNIAGNSTGNQLAQSLGGQEETAVKAYVVSGEVTTAQSLDRNKIQTASI